MVRVWCGLMVLSCPVWSAPGALRSRRVISEVTNPVNNVMAISDILVSEGRCPAAGESWMAGWQAQYVVCG